MFGDQFYWGGRVVQLGLGTTTSLSAMTEESLANALRAALDPTVAARARAFAAQLRSDGAAIAARRLETEFGAAGE